MLSCCRTTQALRFQKTRLSHDSLPKASSITTFQFAANTIHDRALQHVHWLSKLQDIKVLTRAYQKQSDTTLMRLLAEKMQLHTYRARIICIDEVGWQSLSSQYMWRHRVIVASSSPVACMLPLAGHC